MSKIALVHVALIVAGERRLYGPGETLPELPKHDEEALKASKSIADPVTESNAARATAAQQRRGDNEFQAARQRVLAETASTAAASLGAGGDAGSVISSAVVTDGASNSIFKDISAADAAHGNVSVQKVATSVNTAARKTTPAAKTSGNAHK